MGQENVLSSVAGNRALRRAALRIADTWRYRGPKLAALKFGKSLASVLPAADLRQKLLLATLRQDDRARTPENIKRAVRFYKDRGALAGTADVQLLPASFVLKPYVGKSERGLLLIHFEHELARVLSSAKFHEIEERYGILFMSSWVSPFGKELCELAARAQRTFWVLPSLFDDLEPLKALSDLCRPLKFHSASWVNPDFFPVGESKSLDLIMVANFDPLKRHWKLFEALAQMPERYRAVVIGSPLDGRTLADVVQEAESFGVAHRVTFHENPPKELIAAELGRARIFCAMSQTEGSYVAAVEAMMTGTPVAMFRDALVGSKAYINEQTGRLIDRERPTGPQLVQMLSDQASFSPAQWARENLSAPVQCRRLNQALRGTSEGDWTADIKTFFQRRQKKFYLDGPSEEEAMKREYARLREHFGFDMRRPAQYPEPLSKEA